MVNKFSSIAVLILAGGLSQRSQEIKGLRKWQDKYWIEHHLDFFLKLKTGFIFTGLGFNYNEYLSAVPLLARTGNRPINPGEAKISVIINPEPARGMFSTLQTSLSDAINFDWENLFLMPVDTAVPSLETIVKLLEFRTGKVVKPVFSGKAGHPVLLSKDFCHSLLKLTPGDRLDYQVKKLNPSEIFSVKVDDPAVCSNINTPEDWQEYFMSHPYS
jgi:molybdenum cofactor cytidylyltransferase